MFSFLQPPWGGGGIKKKMAGMTVAKGYKIYPGAAASIDAVELKLICHSHSHLIVFGLKINLLV